MAGTIATNINFNADSPAPPSGHGNIIFQTDLGTPVENVTGFDPVMVGDNGSGGFSGNVPGPHAGDAAAGKFLKADGTWAAPTAAVMVGDSGSGGTAGSVPAPPAGSAASNDYLRADGNWANPSLLGWSNGGSSISSGYWTQAPNGFLTQWGKVTTDISGGTLSVGFPKAFTSSGTISVVVTTSSSSDRITYVVDGSVGTLGFTIGNNGSSGYAYWQATGF
jgi:hypothetical protein